MPFRTIIARPGFLTAVVCSMVGYGTMNLVMASTPLQMLFCGFGVNASADVIRAHSIAMFLPGFVTGRLIQRFGAHPIICVGAVLTLLCVVTNLSFAPVLATFMVALALLGVGWNFMFVGGTTLLADGARPARAGPRPGHQRLHRVRHRCLHRVRVRRDRGHRRLDRAEPGGRAADADRRRSGDLALVGPRAPGAAYRPRLSRPGSARRPPVAPVGLAPSALKRPILPNNCCRNDASVPGDGVGARHHRHRHRIVLVQLLHVLQHALVVEAQHHDVLAQHALRRGRSAGG